MVLNRLTDILVCNLFQIDAQKQQQATRSGDKPLKREVFPSKACNQFCHFVNVRHEFLLNRVTGLWNDITNSQVNAKIINSFKTGNYSLPILSVKAYQAQQVQPTVAIFLLDKHGSCNQNKEALFFYYYFLIMIQFFFNKSFHYLIFRSYLSHIFFNSISRIT